MATNKSPIQIMFNDVIKCAVTPILKPIGFRKIALNFYRRRKNVVQVVNFQSSNSSNSNEKLFYINVGLAFDAICELMDVEITEKPKEYECNSRGTRDRLENLIDQAPYRWSLKLNSDLDTMIQSLEKSMKDLVVELQKIDGPQSYSEHHWFNRFRPKGENAQIFYILDDLDTAWQEIEDLCKLFADRKGANCPKWWIQKLNLNYLKSRLVNEKE